MEKQDIMLYSLDELKEYLNSIGEKPFRAKQIYEWLHQKLVECFDDMTNISNNLKEKLIMISIYNH